MEIKWKTHPENCHADPTAAQLPATITPKYTVWKFPNIVMYHNDPDGITVVYEFRNPQILLDAPISGQASCRAVFSFDGHGFGQHSEQMPVLRFYIKDGGGAYLPFDFNFGGYYFGGGDEPGRQPTAQIEAKYFDSIVFCGREAWTGTYQPY